MIFQSVKHLSNLSDGTRKTMRGCEVSRSAPDARRNADKRILFPRTDFPTEIAILYYF